MRAEPDHWKRLPFGDASALPYSRAFDAEEYQRLELGLIPRAMEDKWFIYLQDGELYFHRSWTGQPVYRVRLSASDQGYEVEQALCSNDVLVRSNPRYQAQLLDFLTSNLLLGEAKPFPRPAEVDEQLPGIIQHAFSGTGYRETVVGHKPWWRFWR